MKKTLAGVLAALMVFTMGTTVFAAPSSTKDSDLKKEAEELVTTVESGNSSVTLTSAVVATEDLTAVYEEVTEKIGSDTGFKVLAAVEITSATTLPSGGVSIKFSVSDLTSGTKNVRIYHYKRSSKSWEIKTPYVGNGYVTATFDSLSPFFVVQYDSTPSTSDGSEDQSSSVVNNYYNTTNTTNNTYNNTDSNNTTTVNNTDSNNTTSTTNTDSNNTTTTNNTNSNNTTTTTNTDSNNTTTTNGKKASDKKTASGTTDTTKKSTTKSTTKKDTSSTPSASANSTNDNSSKNSNSNDNSSKNTQTVTVNVSGSGSGSAKAGASTSTTSPKTGSSLPALPMIAVFLVMGIAVCGKKARNL
jgi:hypothetical protein